MSPELQEKLDNGEITLGGCCISDDDPAWECTKCGECIYPESDAAPDD
jgi:hypothetical protein